MSRRDGTLLALGPIPIKAFKRGSLCLDLDTDPPRPGQEERLGRGAHG